MGSPQRLGDSELSRINSITERIIGCAIEVHRGLGPGLLESIYRNALALEFDAAALGHVREARVAAIYKKRVVGTFRVDFIVEDTVVVEVKSVERNDPVFDAQLMTYLRLTGKRVGLLLNFNTQMLKHGISRKIV